MLPLRLGPIRLQDHQMAAFLAGLTACGVTEDRFEFQPYTKRRGLVINFFDERSHAIGVQVSYLIPPFDGPLTDMDKYSYEDGEEDG